MMTLFKVLALVAELVVCVWFCSLIFSGYRMDLSKECSLISVSTCIVVACINLVVKIDFA